MNIAFLQNAPPSTASPHTSSLLLVGRARNPNFLISCRYQRKDPTVRTAQPLSLRQVLPGLYPTEQCSYEFNCRAKRSHYVLYYKFVFVLKEIFPQIHVGPFFRKDVVCIICTFFFVVAKLAIMCRKIL
jgi:hypothetical protein